MSMGLMEFLRARLAEDEEFAREAAEMVCDGRWQQRGARIVTVVDRNREVADYAIVECIDHIARHDPARVLRDVEAAQRIVALHGAEPGQHPDFCGHDLRELPCDTLRLTALRWADHPDYDPAWSPDA